MYGLSWKLNSTSTASYFEIFSDSVILQKKRRQVSLYSYRIKSYTVLELELEIRIQPIGITLEQVEVTNVSFFILFLISSGSDMISLVLLAYILVNS